jgi:predicted hotdog family 3-hydroxylacyl-ACP dehydratase
MPGDELRGAAASSETDLPMPAEPLMPHRPPMRLVDSLVSRDADGGVTESRFQPDSVMADEHGVVDDVALAELIAQSHAAVTGHLARLCGSPARQGWLAAIRDLRITGRARVGDLLVTRVRTIAALDGLTVVEGMVACSGENIARGTLTLRLADEGRPVTPSVPEVER